MRIKRLGYLASIVLSAVSVAIVAVLLVSPVLFWLQLQSIDTQKWLLLTKEAVFSNYMELLYYLMNPFVSVLSMSDIPVSKMGAFHFMEVKHLFIFNGFCAVIFTVFSVKGVRWFSQKGLAIWARQALYISIIGLFALVCTIGIGFSMWFEWFHQIVFRNDAWLFNPRTDPIILVLPETFFLTCFTCVMIGVGIYYWIVICWLKHKNKV